MRPSRIATFVVRSDHFDKQGGDSRQVDEYARFLRAHGWTVNVQAFNLGMPALQGDLVHVFNVDRVFDFIMSVRLAKRVPIFVSPIHHSLSRMQRMRRGSRQARLLVRLADMLPEPLRELLALGYRDLRRGNGNPLIRSLRLFLLLRFLVRPWRAAGRRLDRAAAVFLLAPGEGRDLQRDTGWTGSNARLTPNGVSLPEDLVPPAWVQRRGAVVVGRLEPRKRTLELARAADAHGLALTIVGAASPTDPEYAAKVAAVAESSANVHYLGSLGHPATMRQISRARVLVNASFVEVQSLVELEAAHLGCYIVAAPSGNSRDWLTVFQHHETSTFDIDEIVQAAVKFAGAAEPPPRVGRASYPWTWEQTSHVILSSYEELT